VGRVAESRRVGAVLAQDSRSYRAPVPTPDDPASEYRRLAVEWDEARNTPEQANPLFDQLHACYKALRKSQVGCRAILSLLADPVTAVRLSAATHSLGTDPHRAIAVLEEIAAGPDLHAVTAKWTLRSFRAGTLNLHW